MRSNLGWEDTRWSTLWYFCDAQLIEITGATKIEIPLSQHSCHHRMSTPRRPDAGVPQRPRPAPDAHASLLKLPPPQIIFCAATPAPGLRPLVWVNAP